MRYPIKLDDDYPCNGTDAEGKRVHFHDLLDEGMIVGDEVSGDRLNCYPSGVVVRRPDGLWCVADLPTGSKAATTSPDEPLPGLSKGP